MLSDEEKKAIEDVIEMIELHKDGCLITTEDDFDNLEILLNLLDKQDNRIKELESDKEIKDKMIDLMSEHLTTPIHSKKDVVEYFENLAKESE